MNDLTYLDLFTGIGGFALGFEAAGFRPLAFAETDRDACVVLDHHWPKVRNVGDVTKLCRRVYDCHYDEETGEAWCDRCDAEFGDCACIGTDQFVDEIGSPLVVTGGVPCQPASKIGRRRGADDERWLWPDVVRILRELRPRFGVFENPPDVLALPEFQRTVTDLAALGYDLWWDVIPGAAFGAGHLRERLVMVAADTDDAGLEGHTGNVDAGGQERGRTTEPGRPVTATRVLPAIAGRVGSASWWKETHTGIPVLADGISFGLAQASSRCVGNSIIPAFAHVIAEAVRMELTR